MMTVAIVFLCALLGGGLVGFVIGTWVQSMYEDSLYDE